MQPKDKLIVKIEEVIGLEHVISICYSRISSLIKNGKIRRKFQDYAEMAQANEDELISRFSCCVADKYQVEKKCSFCTMKPESFSLLGAFNLSLEILEKTIQCYKELVKEAGEEEDRELLKGLLKEKTTQKEFLLKERDFLRVDENTLNFIDTYCLPEVISKLWT